MNSFQPFNSVVKATNTFTKSAMNSPISSTVTTTMNSAVGAVNSLGASTFGAMNSMGQTTLSAVNSVGDTAINALNSIGTATLGGLNSAVNSVVPSFANSNVFTNVNTSKNYLNSNYTNSVNTSSSSGGWGMFFGTMIFLVIIFLIAMVMFKDQISVSWDYFATSVKKFFGMEPPANASIGGNTNPVEDPMPTTLDATYKATRSERSILNKILPMGAKEVFNVSSNDYTFYDAEPLCKALGAELATYDQVEKAWENGADWCNYGWSKGQVAIYPTQKDTWDKLQGGEPGEHTACGEPGVNGGYFDNPEMRFGVNCYGVKPDQSSNDERLLMENGTIPKTVATLKIDQQIQDIKNNIDMIGVLPFNGNKWSTS